jgi:hypothetical protein
VLGDLPSEQQLAQMDDQDKAKAIEAVMEERPPCRSFPRTNGVRNCEESIDTMMGGTAERLADFSRQEFS